MKYLTKALKFPPLTHVHATGIVAFGGDLTVERLKLAYNSGIFPWYEDGEPITWWSPNKRMVLFFPEIKISKSMRNVINRGIFTLTYNKCFREVLENCKSIKRAGQKGTWLTNEMIDAYCKLHEIGLAKSVEVWQNNELVGGLYGIDLGHIFCGESMFSKVPNASKFAFIHLAKDLEKNKYELLDCQVYNDHLASLGCREIDRNIFLAYLQK